MNFFFSLVPKNRKIAIAIDTYPPQHNNNNNYITFRLCSYTSYITNMFIVLSFMRRAYTLLFYRAFLNFLFLLNQKLQTTLHTVWSSKSVQLIIPMQQVSENQPCFCVYLYFFSICTIYLLLLLCFLVLLIVF